MNLLSQLKIRNLDAVITNYPAIEDGIELLSEYPMPVMAIHHPDKKFEGSIIKGKSRHKPIQWVLPNRRLRLRSEINTFMKGNILTGQILLESDVLATLVRAVLDGIGTTFLPLPYVQSFVKQGRLIASGPKAGFWTHQLCLLTNSASSKRNIVQSLKNSFDSSMSLTGKRRVN